MKVCVICFDFKKENIRRQPWRYIYEVSEGLIERGIDVVVITDINSTSPDNLKIRSVKKLRSLFGESNEVLQVLREEKPDVVVMLLGMTSFLRLNLKIDKPVVGILTSPTYSLREVINVGGREFLRHFNHIFVHLIGALIPRFLIRRWTNQFNCLVVLSEENKRRLESFGINTEISVIPPGIDEFYLKLPDNNQVEELRNKINPENVSLIMYFTSPLTLRGTDTLVKAFARVRKTIPSRLIILSRLEHRELVKEEKLVKEIAMKEGVTDSVEIISGYLTPEEVKTHLSTADIVCLPFKIVISDVPISILESMALGKPVISTSVGCIPELLSGRGLVVEPNNPEKLANAMMRLLSDKALANELGKRCREYMGIYHQWSDISEKFTNVIQDTVNK